MPSAARKLPPKPDPNVPSWIAKGPPALGSLMEIADGPGFGNSLPFSTAAGRQLLEEEDCGSNGWHPHLSTSTPRTSPYDSQLTGALGEVGKGYNGLIGIFFAATNTNAVFTERQLSTVLLITSALSGVLLLLPLGAYFLLLRRSTGRKTRLGGTRSADGVFSEPSAETPAEKEDVSRAHGGSVTASAGGVDHAEGERATANQQQLRATWVLVLTKKVLATLSRLTLGLVCPFLLLLCLDRWREQQCHKYPFLSELQHGEGKDIARLMFRLAAISFAGVHVFSWGGGAEQVEVAKERDRCWKNRDELSFYFKKSLDLPRRLVAWLEFLTALTVATCALLIGEHPWALHLELHVQLVTIFFTAAGLLVLIFVLRRLCGFVEGFILIDSREKISTSRSSSTREAPTGSGSDRQPLLHFSTKTAILIKHCIYAVACVLLAGGVVRGFLTLREGLDALVASSTSSDVERATASHTEGNEEITSVCQSYHGGGIYVAQRQIAEGNFRKQCLFPLLIGCDEVLEKLALSQYQIVFGLWFQAVALTW
ncbi:unnamed protein product [Amoebophrya sp. A120]|nr:unnamed protein product [Amoebophrya sp. A120]|eukprot:GSA120T00019513001.1